jgi:hypothetical protein
MKQSINIDQRFNDLEMVLENLELHVLQAIWNLENSVQLQIETNKTLREQIINLISAADQIIERKFGSDHSRLENKNT